MNKLLSPLNPKMLKTEGLEIRIKIFFQKSRLNNPPLIVTILSLSFSLCFIAATLSIAGAQENLGNPEEIALEAKREDSAIKEILLQQKRNQKV
ncbi:MAG: hypothetical protein PHY56_07840, partial [Candidatus Omnitrophica bacterium]|nr:hypothetical protein [Candidatus Omnitrophota bacterium]